MPQGVLGGSKTLAWGFAMVPHRLHILVLLSTKAYVVGTPKIGLKETALSNTHIRC